jgi:extracellular matrix regulatory protein A
MVKNNLVNIGYGNFLSREKIIAILQTGSSPVRRLIREARDDRKLLDATTGKKTRSVIVMDNGSIVLSSILPETLAEKFKNLPE